MSSSSVESFKQRDALINMNNSLMHNLRVKYTYIQKNYAYTTWNLLLDFRQLSCLTPYILVGVSTCIHIFV